MTYKLSDVKDAIEKKICENSYYHFFKAAWHVLEPATPLIDAPYIKYLCDRVQVHCEKIIAGEKPDIDLLIVNIPPSTSKSSIITKFLSPWLWLRNATLKIANTSYSSLLANDHCMKSRDLIQSEWFQKRWGELFNLKYDLNTKSKFANDKTGLRLATSTGGALTGFHFHLLIQDDPLDPNRAASQVKLDSAIHFNDKTIPSRILENGFQILVMQRLNENDPTGHELEKTEKIVEHICLPAEKGNNIKPELAKELYKDELLTPRLTIEKLRKFKEDLGSDEYAGQYDQEPSDPTGSKIKRDWFEYCDINEVPRHLPHHLLIDGAYTKSSANDPTGLLVIAYDERFKRMYVLHFHEARMETPELMNFIPEYSNLHGLNSRSKALIEPKATGKTIKQYLDRDTHMNAIELKGLMVSEGKEARIQTAAPKYESGKIIHVKGNWNDKFESQLTGFPRAKHDEGVDLIGYAVDYFFTKAKGISRRN